jgi:DNA topoisomerase IB
VHPGIVEAWETGELNPQMAELRRRFRRPPQQMERDEHLLLQWLLAWNARHAA